MLMGGIGCCVSEPSKLERKRRLCYGSSINNSSYMHFPYRFIYGTLIHGHELALDKLALVLRNNVEAKFPLRLDSRETSGVLIV